MSEEKIKLESEFKDGGRKRWLIVGGIIAVTICSIAAAVSIGLWIGFKERIIKERSTVTDTLDQETDIFPKSKIFVMTSRLGNIESTFVQDYNTHIDVTKSTINGRDFCFVSILNDSQEFNPDTFHLDNKNISKSNFTNTVYEIRGGKLSDVSFLNQQAYNLCKAVDTYWVTKICAPRAPRAKRDLYRHGYNCYAFGYGNGYYGNGYYGSGYYGNGYYGSCLGCYYYLYGQCRDVWFNYNFYPPYA